MSPPYRQLRRRPANGSQPPVATAIYDGVRVRPSHPATYLSLSLSRCIHQLNDARPSVRPPVCVLLDGRNGGGGGGGGVH